MSRPCMPPGRWGAALSLTPVGKGAINKGILWKVSRERKNERITAVFNFSDKKQCVHFSTQEAEVLEPYEMKLCTGYLRA